MARPLRIEFPGAVYHVTSRGDRREPIFDDDGDAQAFLGILAQGLLRFDAGVIAYCLMGNHYHLVLHTHQANLSLLMRHLNGVYTQAYNHDHGKVGHLFQGRFKAILVDTDNYLLQLCPYVELNPVRAGMVVVPADWAWSSYRAHVGRADLPCWLETAALHGYLLGRPACSATDHASAARAYGHLVMSAQSLRLWETALNRQVFLGDDDFVLRMQTLADTARLAAPDVPKA